MKRISILILAVLGALGLFVHLIMPFFHMFAPDIPAKVKMDLRSVMMQSYPSPNGEYVVVHLQYLSGGSIASQCDDVVAIIPKKIATDKIKIDRSFDVFSAECDFYGNHQPAPIIQWKSNSSVEVDFSINSTASASRNFQLKGYSQDHRVSVLFFANT
jgi:hypothetical protein